MTRTRLFRKLETHLGDSHYISRMTKAILSSNTIQIDDNLQRSKQLEQTNGVLQGDPLSPLLFNIMTMDIVDAVITKHLNIYMYADDTVIASRSQEELQAASIA